MKVFAERNFPALHRAQSEEFRAGEHGKSESQKEGLFGFGTSPLRKIAHLRHLRWKAACNVRSLRGTAPCSLASCLRTSPGTEVTRESGHLRYPDATREAHGHSAGYAHYPGHTLRSFERSRQRNRRQSHRPNHLL